MSLKDREEGFFTPLNMLRIFGLLFSILIVGFFYSVIIRPAAEEYRVAESYGLQDQASSFGKLSILLQDYEQQACFTLMLWVSMVLGYKYFIASQEKQAMNQIESKANSDSILQYTENGRISIDHAPKLLRKVESDIAGNTSLNNKLLPHLITKGLERFISSRSIQEASEMIKGRIDLAAERLESELSIVRYIAWAIPSIGFIGTVRGIGNALSMADQALEGDISGVTSSLGLAFNSTLIALFISIILMFLIHLVQSKQEGLILSIEIFCREQFIDRLALFKSETDEIPEQSS